MPTFTTSGTYTPAAGVTQLLVQCWGPGGAGAAGAGGSGGGGGGGGEYASAVVAVTPGSNYNYTIAAATATSFPGDSVTVTAHPGGAGSGVTGGAGGTGSSNTAHFSGGAGGTSSSSGGSGGGSSAGTAAGGNNGTSSSSSSGGAGGTAVTGGAAGGAGGASSATGTAGTAPGGGGGGGGYSLSGHAGGAGAGGQITITVLITGTGSLAAKKPGMSGTGAVVFTGTGSLAVKKPVFAGTGTVSTSFGHLAVKKPGMSGTGTVEPTGTGGVAVKKPGMSGSGTLIITGTGGLAVKKPGFAATSAELFPFPQFPLTLTVELFLNGTWTDVTQYVYQRKNLAVTRGRPDESQGAKPSQLTLTLNNRDGRFSPKNSAGAYYPYVARNIQIRVHVDTASADHVTYSGYRFWGQVAEWLPQSDQTGNDAYCDVTAAGILRIFGQGSNIGSPMRLYNLALSGDDALVAYWPCEDSSKATEIAAAGTPASPMTFTGAPGFAADSSFGGSDPVPGIGSSSWHGQTNAASDPPGTGSLTRSTPGTYTWTAPPGVTTVSVKCTGSGGGGGDAGADGAKGGGGGGGGEQAADTAVAVTPGTTYTFTVPAGGAAGVASNGGDGAAAVFPGDAVTVTGHGGKGGVQGDTSTGGAGGTGSSNSTHHNGGAGGTGQAASGSFQDLSLSGNDGAQGGGSSPAGQQSQSWKCPPGVTTVDVTAVGGGGGGAGGGFFGYGGAGGGGGGYSSAPIDVTPGNSYMFHAGDGGPGGPGNVSLPDTSGGDGANSTVTGDGSTTVTGEGGTAALATSSDHNINGSGGGGSSGNGSDGGLGNNGSNIGGGGGGGGSGDAPGGGGSSSGSFGASGGGDGGQGGNGGSIASRGDTGSGGGGGGGGGSRTSTTGQAGGGGGGGYIEWTYTVPAIPSAGGGGSSGGTSSAGNAGSNSGSGGAAVTGGGAGGNAGAAAGSPGGGGAGGVPADATVGTSAVAAASGAPGSVHLAWDGGVSSPIAGDIIRFLLHVDSSGEADGTVVFRALTYGDVARLDVVYHTGGKLELIGYNGSDVSVFDSGSQSFGADGTPMMVSIELTASGTTCDWKFTAIEPGAGSVIATYTGSVASTDIGNVSDVYINPAAAAMSSSTSAGEVTVQVYAGPLTGLSPVINGYAGEYAADRFTRLCGLVGVASVLIGTNTDTPQMGPQANDTFVNLMQSVEDLDKGQLFEPRDQLGLGYRTRVDLQGQNPGLIIDYSAGHLAGQLQPVIDDQLTRNHITITRQGGSSATAILTDGPMSVLDPPGGVGDYSYSNTVNAYADSQLANLVAWMLTIGTVDEYRYPVVTVDLARTAAAAIFGDTASLDIGDFFEIINPPPFLPSSVINQLADGFTETINHWVWTISVNAVPESPYNESSPPAW